MTNQDIQQEIQKSRLYRPGNRPKKLKVSKVYGYDVETSKDNQNYDLGCIYGENDEFIFFFSREEFKAEIKKRSYRNVKIVAHNLAFDFFATFGHEEMVNFKLGFNGSKLQWAMTYVEDGKFTLYPKTIAGKEHKITFIDTKNYTTLSLKQIGEIIHEPKLNWDFNREIKTAEDKKEYMEYNKQDARIARKFYIFLALAFFEMGANIAITIASTAEKIFRNVYLDRIYEQQSIEEMKFIYRGYFGGRTEVFRRGKIKDRNYLDINSLYPSVMRDNVYPDPNTSRFMWHGTEWHIMNKEGFSEVTIEVPYMKYPPLPWREDKTKKVYFPYGLLTGVWPHPELRNALKLGCKIINYGPSVWYDKTCKPFVKFVNDVYTLRMKHKAENSPLQYVDKLVMNSLYGKFGQKPEPKDIVMHINSLTPLIMDKYEYRIEEPYAFVKMDSKPRPFCFPCWSAYVTSYGRLRLYEYIIESEPDMVDTDSVITSKTLPLSKELGKMKLECHFEEAIIVRPKCYGINSIGTTGERSKEVCCKGMSGHISFMQFEDNLLHGFKNKKGEHSFKAEIRQFITFRESLIRHLKINSILKFDKFFNLEDNKRKWPFMFNPYTEQDSEPVYVPLDEKPPKHNINFFNNKDDDIQKHWNDDTI